MKALPTFVAIFWACSAAAQPWIPEECRQRPEGKWAEFVQRMLEAKPGSPIFAPKPYPTNDAQAIEDFEYGFLFMWKGVQEIPEQQLPLFQGVKHRSVRYRVRRVENWQPSRCHSEQRKDHYVVLDIYDSASARHLARASLMQSGLIEPSLCPGERACATGGTAS